MTSWHQTRRILAAIIAGLTASVAHRQGLPLWQAVLLGFGLAVLVSSVVLPLLWKPPRDQGRKGPKR